MAKTDEKKEGGMVTVREVPPDVQRKLKAAAALQGKTLQQYLLDLYQAHVTDLERRGIVPKGKG
jgi:uncharacterized protein (DUF1778 family)